MVCESNLRERFHDDRTSFRPSNHHFSPNLIGCREPLQIKASSVTENSVTDGDNSVGVQIPDRISDRQFGRKIAGRKIPSDRKFGHKCFPTDNRSQNWENIWPIADRSRPNFRSQFNFVTEFVTENSVTNSVVVLCSTVTEFSVTKFGHRSPFRPTCTALRPKIRSQSAFRPKCTEL